MKYTLNVQGTCNWKGLFLDVDVRWPGSVHDARVFANSRINKLLKEEQLPFPNTHSNEEVIFNNMTRSARNPIECAYGRLKARWQILNKRIDMKLSSIPIIVYACFVLHNICEMKGVNIDDDTVAQQIAHDKLTQPCTAADRLYSFNSAEGTHVRNVITLMYKEHLSQ